MEQLWYQPAGAWQPPETGILLLDVNLDKIGMHY